MKINGLTMSDITPGRLLGVVAGFGLLAVVLTFIPHKRGDDSPPATIQQVAQRQSSSGIIELCQTEWRGVTCQEPGRRIDGEILTDGVWWEVRFNRDEKQVYSMYPGNLKPGSQVNFTNGCAVVEWRIKPGEKITLAKLSWAIRPGDAPVPNEQIDMEKLRLLEREKTENAKKAAEEATAKHEKYLQRYLNSRSERKPGIRTVAIVAASQDGKASSIINSALARHISSTNIETFSAFFTPEFISDGLFAEVFNGSTDAITKLELAKSLDAVLLARENLQFSKDTSMENLVTANLQLEVVLSSVTTRGQIQAWTFTAYGAGFDQQAARQAAIDRIVKQITNDKKMTL
jgi:hypothetical protein